MERSELILEFWFGVLDKDGMAGENASKRWYTRDPLFDEALRKMFSKDLELAKNGTYALWEENPRSSLALILLLDQCSRNIYRNTKNAFSADIQAQEVAERALHNKFDTQLPIALRQSLYMPFMHAEDIAQQEKSLALYRALQNEVKDELKDRVSVSYAETHHAIIKEFGRFPFRNKILGRTSTPEEKEFLTHPTERI